MPQSRRVAYFSMEVGLEASLPTYSGGLGVLAGDFARAAADLDVPMVVVTLVHRQGYFHQTFATDGRQIEQPVNWSVDDQLTRLDPTVTVSIGGRDVHIGAWRIILEGVGGREVPVVFLDTRLPQNHPDDRAITDQLYGGDETLRLRQEIVLGIGGVRMLRALRHHNLRRFHMNEGHAALLTLELLREEAIRRDRPASDDAVIAAVRDMCVFTTHTPVAAGHDKFPMDLVEQLVEPRLIEPFRDHPRRQAVASDGHLNMTFLGFSLSRYINGVAKRHGEVSRQMFGDYPIDAITNGVQVSRWAAPPMARLFDAHIPGWRSDPFSLRNAGTIDSQAIREAHRESKRQLLDHVDEVANAGFDADVFTIGFGRRATAYKRMHLILADPSRLKALAERVGAIQLIFAGKAHPRDEPGKALMKKVIQTLPTLGPTVRGVYLPDYDMNICGLMVGGCDLWLNTPRPPLEASGTSGMKAAINGVPSLSVLDGWWLEGCIPGVTGWAIGADAAGEALRNGSAVDPAHPPTAHDDARAAESLYRQLETHILPLYYQRPEPWAQVMRNAIAINGSFFNTHRMMLQYVTKAYFG